MVINSLIFEYSDDNAEDIGTSENFDYYIDMEHIKLPPCQNMVGINLIP